MPTKACERERRFFIAWSDLKHAVRPHTTIGEWKVSKGKKIAILDSFPSFIRYYIAVSCICDSLWCDRLGKWTDIQPLTWVESTRGGQCSSCCFRAILQYHPSIERTLVTLLSITHLSLSLFLYPILFLFISFSLSFTLACSHAHTVSDGHCTWSIDFLAPFQQGSQGQSRGLCQYPSPAETKPKLLRLFNSISTDMYWISPDTSSLIFIFPSSSSLLSFAFYTIKETK